MKVILLLLLSCVAIMGCATSTYYRQIPNYESEDNWTPVTAKRIITEYERNQFRKTLRLSLNYRTDIDVNNIISTDDFFVDFYCFSISSEREFDMIRTQSKYGLRLIRFRDIDTVEMKWRPIGLFFTLGTFGLIGPHFYNLTLIAKPRVLWPKDLNCSGHYLVCKTATLCGCGSFAWKWNIFPSWLIPIPKKYHLGPVYYYWKAISYMVQYNRDRDDRKPKKYKFKFMKGLGLGD